MNMNTTQQHNAKEVKYEDKIVRIGKSGDKCKGKTSSHPTRAGQLWKSGDENDDSLPIREQARNAKVTIETIEDFIANKFIEKGFEGMPIFVRKNPKKEQKANNDTVYKIWNKNKKMYEDHFEILLSGVRDDVYSNYTSCFKGKTTVDNNSKKRRQECQPEKAALTRIPEITASMLEKEEEKQGNWRMEIRRNTFDISALASFYDSHASLRKLYDQEFLQGPTFDVIDARCMEWALALLCGEIWALYFGEFRRTLSCLVQQVVNIRFGLKGCEKNESAFEVFDKLRLKSILRAVLCMDRAFCLYAKRDDDHLDRPAGLFWYGKVDGALMEIMGKTNEKATMDSSYARLFGSMELGLNLNKWMQYWMRPCYLNSDGREEIVTVAPNFPEEPFPGYCFVDEWMRIHASNGNTNETVQSPADVVRNRVATQVLGEERVNHPAGSTL